MNMFSSLRARLWLSYAFLIAMALAIVGVVLLLFLLRNPILYRQTTLRLGVAEGVLLRAPLDGGQFASVAQAFGVRAFVLGPDGALLADSDPSASVLRLPTAPLGQRALASARDQGGRLWLYSMVRRPDGNWLLVAAPRPGLAPVLGVLSDELVRPMLQGGLIALLLALVLAYGLARWIADPLQRLIAAASQFAKGVPGIGSRSGGETESPRPVLESGPQEVRQLTRAFNAMVGRVQASQRSQRELVANVSHELKTPLTSLQGFSQALIDGAAQTAEAREHAAQVIHEEAGRMHRMVVELLDLARLDAGTAELLVSEVDVSRLLKSVVDKFTPIAGENGIALGLEVASGIPTIAGDGERLAQVFTNLLDNAVKFTPRKGQIKVKAEASQAGVQVSVADTGAGILKEDLPRIFDRFYQADSAREGGRGHGAGLGLAIVQEIVNSHGGRISVRSTPGVGSEFSVYLPVRGVLRPK